LNQQFPKDRAGFTPQSHHRHWPSINLDYCPDGVTHVDQHLAHAAARERRISLGAPTTSNRFPLNNFKHFLTLFSKFFSSFPHGTCSLSVSRHYLALEGIYLQFWAAFPNNPTRGKHLVVQQSRSRRGSHPLGRRLPADLNSSRHRGHFCRLQFSKGRFSSWAFPGSLAVTRGILVGFFSSAY
jgi:hypothetical protein